MKKVILPLLLCGSVLSLVFTRCTSDADAVEAKYIHGTTPPDQLCLVDPSWFPHTNTPAPEEGIGSPFDAPSTTNAIFHQWSWNKFLWLTKPDQGSNPLFLNPAKVFQVSTAMERIKAPSGTLLTLKDVNQAGPNSSILQTNPDYNKDGISETVYYSIHMNPKMFQAARKYAKMITDSVMPASNDSTFPVGSFELKVAWVPLSAIPAEKQGLYYKTTASLSADRGKTYVNTDVALIGMHVVGVVQNHPEFIWATFEHEDLSPDYNWESGQASSSEDQLLFKKGTTNGIDGVVYDPKTNLGVAQYQMFDLFEYGVPRDKNGFMKGTSQEEPENFNNIQGINECVHAKLDDVWKNYFYNGSIWMNTDGMSPERQAFVLDSLGDNLGNAGKGSFARGSLNCANVTMESFTQTFETNAKDINVNTLANCFSCHSAETFDSIPKISPLYMSHVFQDYVSSQLGKSPAEIEKLKLKDEKRTQVKMRMK